MDGSLQKDVTQNLKNKENKREKTKDGVLLVARNCCVESS